jgi:hypothetical protein
LHDRVRRQSGVCHACVFWAGLSEATGFVDAEKQQPENPIGLSLFPIGLCEIPINALAAGRIL